MATLISLNCSECGVQFQKSKTEMNRRKHKLISDNWFCGLSCTAKYRNRIKPTLASQKPPTQWGNRHRAIYDFHLAWYVKRLAGDIRNKCALSCSKEEIHNHLREMWDGKCAISGQPLFRKDPYGKCDSSNPFHIASVDRIHNDKPYGIGNVRWTSVAMNMARNGYGVDEFQMYYDEFRAT